MNEEETNSIPREAGSYIIVIDYSELYQIMDHIEPIVEVNDFVSFAIDGSFFGK